MRLTLRTLLAYLDDILPPAETKEMGEKIAASPVAAQLVDRIRDVMRRRRLTAPEVDGSGGGIEPNLVAEYLDNSLPPEKVADVERVCLESDVNLAEVAACHQILTLVLGEPVEITGRLRERMYALGPQGTPLDVPEPAASRNVRETNAREQLAAIKDAQKPKPKPAPAQRFESRVPEYLRTKPLWQRVLPWMIVPLLLLAYFALFYYDPTFFGGRKKAAEPEGGRVAEAEKAPPKVADSDRNAEGAATAGATAAAAATDRKLPDLPVDAEPPKENVPVTGEEATAGSATKTETTTRTEATGEAVASTTATTNPPAPQPTATEQPAAAQPAPPAVPAGPPQLDVVSADGVVLRFDPRNGQWLPLGGDEDPAPGIPIAVPDPFRAELAAAGLPLKVTALGGTRLAAFGATAAAPVGFDVTEGRLRIAADSAAKSVDQLMFALWLGRGLWRVEPLTPDTTLALEAIPLQPTAEGQDLRDRTPQGVVYVVAGTARVADASGHVAVVAAGNRMILTPVTGGDPAGLPPAGQGGEAPPVAATATDVAKPAEAPTPAETPVPSAEAATAENAPAAEAAPAETAGATPAAEAAGATAAAGNTPAPAEAAPGTPEPVPPLGLPEWVTPSEPTPAARRAMTAFKNEFVPGAPAGGSLLPAVRSRLFYVAEPAAKALGLIEDVDGLVKTLRDTEHPEAVIAATNGIRNWLGRAPDRAEFLRSKLEETFGREGLALTLYRLLWGYGPEDARDEATAAQLVDWLGHPEPIVRELAFYYVRRLSGGRTMNYNPTGTVGQRAGALNQWKAFVERHGGLVVK